MSRLVFVVATHRADGAITCPSGWLASPAAGRSRWTARRKSRYLAVMEPEDIMRRIEMLKQDHRDLDSAIDALARSGSADQLQLARLKKRKLALRDEIAMLEDALIPDIIA